MRKLLSSSLLFFLLVGCSENTQNVPSPDVDISAISVSISSNEELSEQYVIYSMTFSYSKGLDIKHESMEPLVAGWIEERMVDNKIEKIEETDDNHLELEGKVAYDSKDLTKADIMKLEEEEESILGVIFETENGERYQAVIVDSQTKLIKIGK